MAPCWWSFVFLMLWNEPLDVSYSLETRPGRVSCEIAAPCPVYTAHAVRRFLFSRSHGACPLVFSFQVSWPICVWMCWTLTCGRAQRVLSSVSSGTLMTVLECWIRGKISVHELQRLLNGWNASIKVPLCRDLQARSHFWILALEKT